MKKNLIFFTFFLSFFLASSLYSKNIISGLTSCNFKNLENAILDFDTKKIDHIKIEVENYRKWSKNNIKILTSPSRYISEKYKNKFKSNLIIFYEDNTKCYFKANIRQSGDEKDHIDLKNNSIIQSLDVQLKDGNIRGITRFKLYKPNTRGNHEDEILQTQLLRNFGYLAPRTFNIKVKFNDIDSVMLFQEKAEKELLEFNNRREGPILEGDEKFFWKVVRNIPDNNKSGWDVGIPYFLNKSAKSMLAKATNANLIIRSEQHKNMFFEAIDNLNTIYLYWGNRFQDKNNNFFYFDYDLDNSLLANQNKDAAIKLEMYNLLIQATNSQHGLAASNRKFYWNSLANYFEPINYDSNPNIDLDAPTTTSSLARLPISKNYLDSFEKLSNKLKAVDINSLQEQINNSGISLDQEKLKKKLDKILINLKILKDNYLNTISFETIDYNSYKEIEDIYYNFNNSMNEIDPNVLIVKKNSNDDKLFRCKIYFKDCEIFKLDEVEISKLMEGNLNKDKKIYQYVGTSLNKIQVKYFKKKYLNSDIFYEDGIDLFVNERENIIKIFQKKEGAKILIINGELINTQVIYEGIDANKLLENNKNYTPPDFPINSDGVTGCLSLINLHLDNVNLVSKNSSCEDAINLVNVKGSINLVDISNTFSDALDADFSNIEFNNVSINRAGNDCSDFSGGIYNFNKIELYNCSDKGVSIGEKSKVHIKNVYVKKSTLGVVSKDSSITQIDLANIDDVNICLASYNKKQEFFGSIINIKGLNCVNYLKFTEEDNISNITIKN